jgi:hypothetical protein
MAVHRKLEWPRVRIFLRDKAVRFTLNCPRQQTVALTGAERR